MVIICQLSILNPEQVRCYKRAFFFFLTVLFRDLNKWVTGPLITVNVRLCEKRLVSTHMKENKVPVVSRGSQYPSQRYEPLPWMPRAALGEVQPWGPGTPQGKDSFRRHLTCGGGLSASVGPWGGGAVWLGGSDRRPGVQLLVQP